MNKPICPWWCGEGSQCVEDKNKGPTCKCMKGYRVHRGKCVEIKPIGTDIEVPPGLVEIPGDCQPTCPKGAKCFEKKCYCDEGLEINERNECIKFVSTTPTTTTPTTTKIETDSEPKCPKNAKSVAGDSKCYCDEGMEIKDDECVKIKA